MLTIDNLRAYGADVDEGLVRCLNKEDFYIRLVKIASADPNFEALKAAVEAKDLEAAFSAAHALKGVVGNLSITPLYKPISEMTEYLRAREDIDYSGYLKEIGEKAEALRALDAE